MEVILTLLVKSNKITETEKQYIIKTFGSGIFGKTSWIKYIFPFMGIVEFGQIDSTDLYKIFFDGSPTTIPSITFTKYTILKPIITTDFNSLSTEDINMILKTTQKRINRQELNPLYYMMDNIFVGKNNFLYYKINNKLVYPDNLLNILNEYLPQMGYFHIINICNMYNNNLLLNKISIKKNIKGNYILQNIISKYNEFTAKNVPNIIKELNWSPPNSTIIPNFS